MGRRKQVVGGVCQGREDYVVSEEGRTTMLGQGQFLARSL